MPASEKNSSKSRKVAAGAAGSIEVGTGNILWVPKAASLEAQSERPFDTAFNVFRALLRFAKNIEPND